MKRYFCDVCGTELADRQEEVPDAGLAADLCGLEDLCPRRNVLARSIDVTGLVMAALRRLVAAAPEESEPSAVPKGKGAKEKRAILAAVEAYRKEHGPGAITALAKLSRVDEGALRDMISCEKVPLTTWRAVGKALRLNVEEGEECLG